MQTGLPLQLIDLVHLIFKTFVFCLDSWQAPSVLKSFSPCLIQHFLFRAYLLMYGNFHNACAHFSMYEVCCHDVLVESSGQVSSMETQKQVD